MMKGNPNALSFQELVSVLLQEDQSRQNRSIMRVADQAFVASQRGKNKDSYSSSKYKSTNAAQPKKEYKDEKKPKKHKQFCKYCKANDYVIKSCPKLAALLLTLSLPMLCRMQNGHLVHSAVIILHCTTLAYLLLTQMCGTLTVVPLSILLRNAVFSPLWSLPLQGTVLHVQITPLIHSKELDRLFFLLQMAAPSLFMMLCMC